MFRDYPTAEELDRQFALLHAADADPAPVTQREPRFVHHDWLPSWAEVPPYAALVAEVEVSDE